MSGHALGDRRGVDRRGLQRVGLAAFFDARGTDLAQAQELPAGQEEREGDECEDAGREECDDGERVGLLDLPGQRQRQVTGSGGRNRQSGASRGNVLQVQADAPLAARLLEPHVGGRQLRDEFRRGGILEGLCSRLHAGLRAGLGGVRVRRRHGVVRLGLELRTIRLHTDDLGVGRVANPALDVLRRADAERDRRTGLRRRGNRHIVLDDRQYVAARHDQISRRIDRGHLLCRRPEDGQAEQSDEGAYESDNEHRRRRHVSLKKFHGCSSYPRPAQGILQTPLYVLRPVPIESARRAVIHHIHSHAGRRRRRQHSECQ